MLTVRFVVASGMTIWMMRSLPGCVAQRIERVSLIDWLENVATALANRISFSKVRTGVSWARHPSGPSVSTCPGR